MKLQQIVISDIDKVDIVSSTFDFSSNKASLVLVFGERVLLEQIQPYKILKQRYLEAEIIICSTSGQFSNFNLIDNKIVATAIQFEKTIIKAVEIDLLANGNIKELGLKIKKDLIKV
jgi:hypothetical protein